MTQSPIKIHRIHNVPQSFPFMNIETLDSDINQGQNLWALIPSLNPGINGFFSQNTESLFQTYNQVALFVPQDGIIKDFWGNLSNSLVNGSAVITLYKSGRATSMSVTLNKDNQTKMDPTDSISVVAGDSLAIAYSVSANFPQGIFLKAGFSYYI